MNTDNDWEVDPDDLVAGSRDLDHELARAAAAARREARATLAPAQAALNSAGFYAYLTLDEENRWTVAADSEQGHVDVRLGPDGYTVELWNSSPGLFADEENEFRRRVLERVARMTVPRVAQGLLEAHQTATWDEVEQGVVVRVAYDLPFGRGDEIGEFARERLPELDELLTFVERQVTS